MKYTIFKKKKRTQETISNVTASMYIIVNDFFFVAVFLFSEGSNFSAGLLSGQ